MELAIAFVVGCLVVYGLVWSVRSSGSSGVADPQHGHGGHH